MNLRKHTDMPIQAWMGTMYMKREDTLLEFYSYIDPCYKSLPIYTPWEQKIICVTFHHVMRHHRQLFHTLLDFELHETEDFHKLVRALLRHEFTMYT